MAAMEIWMIMHTIHNSLQPAQITALIVMLLLGKITFTVVIYNQLTKAADGICTLVCTIIIYNSTCVCYFYLFVLIFISESPYGDVSGLPDPYLEQLIDNEEHMKPQPHLSMSYDESLESGYSTPNSRTRRIIREIIV